MYHELRKRGTSPHFSHSMWPAPVQEADRAGAARRAMWDIGQARRRTLSASSTGPLGCLSAGISSVGRLNRMPDTLFAARRCICLAERATQAAWSVRNAGHVLLGRPPAARSTRRAGARFAPAMQERDRGNSFLLPAALARRVATVQLPAGRPWL